MSEDDILARIAHGARTGAIVNLAVPAGGDPAAAVSNDIENPDDWQGRTVQAADLQAVILRAARAETPHPRGIHIIGLRVVGPLDLYNVTLPFPLRFQSCRFEDEILIGHARTETLEFSECFLKVLIGRRVRIGGNFKMQGSICTGPVVLEGADIAGWADFWGSHLLTDGPDRVRYKALPGLPSRLLETYADEYAHALLLSVAKIGNDLRLTNVRACGPLLLDEMQVGKRFYLDDAHVAAYQPKKRSYGPDADRTYAVKAGGLQVLGNTYFNNSQFKGEIRLTGTRIVGSIRFLGTVIESPNNRSLMLDRAIVSGDLLFGDRKPYEIGDTSDDPAGGDQRRRCKMQGAVRMRKIKIEGDLNLSDTELRSLGYQNGFALRATGAEVNGEMIALGLNAYGTVDFANAVVKRKIRFVNSTFQRAEHTRRELNAAFEGNHIAVGSDFVLTRTHFDGPLYLQDASLQGSLICEACRFAGFHAERDAGQNSFDQVALAAERLSLGANLQITDLWPGGRHTTPATERSLFRGGLSLVDASIEGALLIHGGTFEGLSHEAVEASRYRLTLSPEEAINARGITVNRNIRISDHAFFSGRINLEEASVEDEVVVKQAVLISPAVGESLRLALANIGGSVFIGHYAACLDTVFLDRTIADHDIDWPWNGRPLSLLSCGQVNLSGAQIEGFLRLQSAHIERATLAPLPGATLDMSPFALNASMAEIGKDVFVHLSDPEQREADGQRLNQTDPREDRYLVTVRGPTSFEQTKITGNLSLDHIILHAHSPGSHRVMAGPGRGFEGSALLGGGAVIQRSVFFGPHFRSLGEVNMARAIIAQGFVSEGTHERLASAHHLTGSTTAKALACQAIHVGVSVELRRPFKAHGPVDFTLAVVDSTFRCLGAFIGARNEVALEMPSAHIGRKLILDPHARIDGDVDLTGAQVDHDAEFWRQNFEWTPALVRDASGDLRPRRMVARRLKVVGTLFCGVTTERMPNGANGNGETIESGDPGPYELDLTDADVGTLRDDPGSWPEPGHLILNGFTYDRLGEGAPADADTRYDWLLRQPPAQLSDQFNPHAFDQLAQVLRGQGRSDEAESIDVRKRALRRKHERNLFFVIMDRIQGITMRYGYQPWRAIIGSLLFTVAGWLIFEFAHNEIHPEDINGPDPQTYRRCMAPADPEYYFTRTRLMPPAPNGESRATLPPDFPRFDALHFSLDLIVPIVDLRQARYWIASSHDYCRGMAVYFIRDPETEMMDPYKDRVLFKVPLSDYHAVWGRKVVFWYKVYQSLHIVLGWFFTTLFAALITGLVRPKSNNGW